jgi:hypothetical protein
MPLSEDPKARSNQLANLVSAPPAPEGHTRTVKDGHSATAKTLPVESREAEIYAQLAEETPLRDGDGGLPIADRTTVEMLALALCRLESCAHYTRLHGYLDGKGRPRPTAEHERRLREEVKGLCKELGLTPRARVAIGLNMQRGVTLAELLSDLPEGGEDG